MPGVSEILNKKPVPCACGITHIMSTEKAAVTDNAPQTLAKDLEGDQQGSILLVCDENTYEVLGKKAQSILSDICPIKVSMLPGKHPHAQEDVIGGVLMDVENQTTRLVAVGSGTVNDTTRYIAYRTGLPYDILGTAPSMDGYASTVSPMIRKGFKLTIEAKAPQHAYLDLPTMQNAPKEMIAAGVGDLLGKYTALADWRIGRDTQDEYYCPYTAKLIVDAVELCINQAQGLPLGQSAAIASLGEGLLLAGVAMQGVGNSRPASGSEHHLSHFWEMQQMQRGETPTLHGDKVGVATLLIIDYYKKLFAKRPSLPAKAQPVHENTLRNWDSLAAEATALAELQSTVEKLLIQCGGPVKPEELGIAPEDVKSALLHAMEVRPRYTVLRLGTDWGMHEDIVEQIMEERYG